MLSTSPSSTSQGSDTTLVHQKHFDVYLQAIFGYLHPKHYDVAMPNLRVVEYSEDSRGFWNTLGNFVRFASKYQSMLNEDLVMVIQNGAKICGEIISFLENTGVRYKYLVGPANCFILTMLSTPHEASSSTIPNKLIHISGLAQFVETCGSYEVNLRLHSMLEICENLFTDSVSREKAKRVVADKNRDGLGVKLPDNCIFPTHLPLIRLIQGAPKIPPFMVETGMSDETTKVEVDCISIILGVSFMVESVLGIALHTSENSRKLKSIDFIVFDASISAMLAIFSSLSDDYQKALVSIVLKRKAQFKLDEVRAIRQLKECIDNNGDYKSVCDDIAKQYRQQMKHDRMRHLNAPDRPDEVYLKETFQEFAFKNANLLSEERHYQKLINTCDDAWKVTGQQLDSEKIREAEVFMIQQIYRQRIVQTVTAKVQQDMAIPGTALSSTYWWGQAKVVIPAYTLRRCFGYISTHCTESNLELCTIKVETPWHYLRNGSHTAVALLNRPDHVPGEAALGHLEQLYENHSQRPPKIKTRLEHWKSGAIKLQLTEWHVPDNGNRYALLVKLLDRYTEKNGGFSPCTPPAKSPKSTVSSDPVSSLRRGIKRVKLRPSTSDQKNLPPNVACCLTALNWSKREKLRKLLLKDEFDQVLLEINDDELATKGLKDLFQENMSVVRFALLELGSVIQYLRGRALRQS
uniref:ARAD1C18524p n=1 Tax=Blastobotrys adeninivorans TaxID=409370 RepID=A0A060T0V3_BLAAD